MDNLTLPKSLDIDGKLYSINSDFRTVIRIFEMLEDQELTDSEKYYCLLYMFYVEVPDGNIDVALQQANWFINGGQSGTGSGRRKDYGRLYSWTQDRLIIISAVDSELGFSSRSRNYLHWWDWLSAFMAIGDCAFTTIVHMRKKKKLDKLSKTEQEIWAEDPDTYELRENIENTEEILAYLNG